MMMVGHHDRQECVLIFLVPSSGCNGAGISEFPVLYRVRMRIE
jgi:hypothetical protein